MSKTLTKAALLSELESCRVIIDQQRRELASLRRATTEKVGAPIVVMSLDRAWAFKAREQLARTRPARVEPITIVRNGQRVTAYAVH